MPVALRGTGGLWHYWQPVSRWRPQSLLANPGNPALIPHSKRTSRDSSLYVHAMEKERAGGNRGLQLNATCGLHKLCLCKKIDDSKGQPAIFAHADFDTVGHRAVLLNSLCKLNKTTV